jgi:hypothetical protein
MDKMSKELESNVCCECVEEMADKLKKFEGSVSDVFEEGNEAVVCGTIKKVIDDEVLHMQYVYKTVFTPNSGTQEFWYCDLYISICSISEFAPLFPVCALSAEEIMAKRNEMQENAKASRKQ